MYVLTYLHLYTSFSPKIVPKIIKNAARNRGRGLLKWILGRPKWIRNRIWSFKNRFRSRFRFRIRVGSILDSFLLEFWPNLGPSWGASWNHVGQKLDFWRFPKACKNDHDFQHSSGPSWDRFWNDFGVQNRTKIGPASVSRAIMKQMQRSSKSSTGAVFLRIGRIEKRSKSNKKSS